MRLAVRPTLEVLRRLLDLPRGMDRLRADLAELAGGTDDLSLPIASFDPMSREHVAERPADDALVVSDDVRGAGPSAAAAR